MCAFQYLTRRRGIRIGGSTIKPVLRQWIYVKCTFVCVCVCTMNTRVESTKWRVQSGEHKEKSGEVSTSLPLFALCNVLKSCKHSRNIEIPWSSDSPSSINCACAASKISDNASCTQINFGFSYENLLLNFWNCNSIKCGTLGTSYSSVLHITWPIVPIIAVVIDICRA